MKILILGHNGMLGHMVDKFLRTKNEIEIIKNYSRWPTEEFKENVINFDGDYIVNCIGAIHQRTNQFEVNWELPEFLDINAKCYIIHPGTDCEMDNDPYGISKKKAKDYITQKSYRTKSLKTSIIGPELNTKASLMEWFLSQPEDSTIKGFSEYYWNGNTTLTWAKFCYEFITTWNRFSRETIISSECISKYEILTSLSEVFEKKINIIPHSEPQINKCLDGDFQTSHIKQQLYELKEFINL